MGLSKYLLFVEEIHIRRSGFRLWLTSVIATSEVVHACACSDQELCQRRVVFNQARRVAFHLMHLN